MDTPGVYMYIFLIVITSLGMAVQVSSTYCQANISSNYTGPPFPVLPQQYQLTLEANINDGNETVTGFEYFDNPGNRATLQMIRNGITYTLVFDYANNQLFFVSNGICKITPLLADDDSILFGNITSQDGVPHVFTTGGALHFAQSFGEQYMGQATIRGILCDHWRSCMYWPKMRSNFTLDYYFTAQNWKNAQAVPQIPVRAVATGVQSLAIGGTKNFTHYYEYINFQTSISDESIFQTPKGVVCQGRKITKTIPTLPDFYHYRQEIVVNQAQSVFLADVWYDKLYRYIRYDYRNSKQIDPLNTLDPITEIHDYNYGIRYVKDQVTGYCVSSAINNASFDVAPNTTVFQNGSMSYILHMKDPMQLFYLDNTYAFTGQRIQRGLLCDVFTTIRNDYLIPGIGTKSAVFEYYFLADGYSEIPDDGSTSPEDVPIYLEVTVPDLGYIAKYNFVDFDEEHPDISIFDVSSCYSESSKLQFTVRFPGSYKTGTSDQILLYAQRQLRETMNVNPIRVQDVRLDYDNSMIYISATLIDRSPYLAQFMEMSNKEIDQNDDKVFTMDAVQNISDCSRLCVTNTDFTCNSFDFCPQDFNTICRLSKSHIGDTAVVVINSSCDHFSRTVNGPAIPEVSILQAYSALRTAVFSQALSLQIVIDGQVDPIIYVAVDIAITFGWLSQKPIPTLTGQFSYHLEMTVPSIKAVLNSHIYYDSDFKLVRIDIVNTNPSPPFNTVDPITTIHDYTSGLSYTLDRLQDNCTIAPITNNSFDVAQNGRYVVKMKSPLDLFYLNGSYTYAGQRTIRGILCDVFEDKRTDYYFTDTPTPTESIFQFYFMSDDWKELSEEDGTSVSSQPIALVISSTAGKFSVTYNIYDFSEQHPDLSNFDIRSCYEGNQQRHFLLKFQGDYHPTLDTYLKQFAKSVQELLSFLTASSFLRFQDPEITYTDGYVYYLATMVEQAPYLLDFTKTSNNIAIYPADKTIDDINSDVECALLCRKENTFDCRGFDYCATVRKCQLSKSHSADSGPATTLSQTCDHYSKTVDLVAPIEPTISEAFIVLKDIVYTKRINITIYNALTKQNVIYSSVLFDEDIIRPDSTATRSNNLNHFVPARRKVILPNIDVQFKGLSVDQCADRCLNEPTIDCQSFDYCFDTGTCILSKMHPDQNITLIQTNAMCDLYARSYLDSYIAYPGTTVQTDGDTTILRIYSADFCAQKCFRNSDFSCKSFDYCSNTNTCILKRTHILNLPTAQINANSICSHFSRKYIQDFDITNGRNFNPDGKILQFINISKDGCAKLCVENTGMDCKAFTFCQSTGVCTIVYVSPRDYRANISTSQTCDLYTRTYFPPTEADTNIANFHSEQSVSSNSGYSAGAMAGLAIGMLIPGMVIGAALLYFLRTKRLVQEEKMRMGFVNMGHDQDEVNENIRPADIDSEPVHQHQYDCPKDNDT